MLTKVVLINHGFNVIKHSFGVASSLLIFGCRQCILARVTTFVSMETVEIHGMRRYRLPVLVSRF
jgi:hypothetical protein